MVEKLFCQADLSGWLSPDEERLLGLFRGLDSDAAARLLYQLMRERFLAARLADAYDPERDKANPTWYLPELLEELRLIRPEPTTGPDVFWDDAETWKVLMVSAWPEGYDKVVLGPEMHDGANADRLMAGIHRIWDLVGPDPTNRDPLELTRRDCLAYVEQWRQEAMSWVFRDRGE